MTLELKLRKVGNSIGIVEMPKGSGRCLLISINLKDAGYYVT